MSTAGKEPGIGKGVCVLMRPIRLIPALLAFAPFVAAERVTLENRFLAREWETDGGLHTVAIRNKLAGKTSAPGASDEFRLRVSEDIDVEGSDRTLVAKDFRITGVSRSKSGDVETVVFKLAGTDFDGALHCTLGTNDFYLRKRLVLTPKKALWLERADIDALALPGARQPYTISKITADAPAQWKPGLGQPLYGDTDATFWGVEFPASTNTVKDGALTCGYPQGRKLAAGTPYVSYPSVMGVADDAAFLQDAFFDYIDRIRIRPFRIQTQYNCWFDLGPGVNAERFAKSVATIDDELVKKRGVKPLDAYVVDDGWQDVKASWSGGVWPVNAKFDKDFAATRAMLAGVKSHLGLWLSPGMVFGAAAKVPALKKEGYETLGHWASLAGPKYMDALEKRMAELVSQGVTFYKLDGVFGHLNRREFDLHGKAYGLPELPYLGAGDFKPDDKRLNDPKYDALKTYYLVAGTERLMKNFDRLAAVNPDVYIVISNAAYLSPWWLQHCDASWMINAGDAAAGKGRTDELVYRDSILYALSVRERTQFPLNAIFNHEPKKTSAGEDPETFRRYLFMALSRGTGFLEFYLKPSALKAPDWNVLAEGMLWTETTGAAFKRSRLHGGDPAKREVYGYTGWLTDRGYASFHNPSDKPATYRFTLDRKSGLIPGSGPFRLSSPLDGDADGLKPSYAYGESFELTLKPGEVRILNFTTTSADWSKIRALRAK